MKKLRLRKEVKEVLEDLAIEGLGLIAMASLIAVLVLISLMIF